VHSFFPLFFLMRRFLAGQLASRNPHIGTEARQSIRSALDDYRALEIYLESCSVATSKRRSFESLVQHSSVSDGCKRFEGKSCGNTVQCFASIFLNRSRINEADIYAVLSGGVLSHMWFAPALFLCTIVGAFPRFLFRACSADAIWFRPSMCERYQSAMASARDATLLRFPRYCRAVATAEVDSFREQLLLVEDMDKLPRVFFISLTWLLVDSLSAHLGSQRHHRAGEVASDVWDGLQDHAFAFIKRVSSIPGFGYEYQIIQGYMDSATETGYDALQWQQSGNRFCKSTGFGPETLGDFMAHLRAFAENHRWDGANHAATFNVKEDRIAGRPYLPSFACHELEDSHIVGWGERPMSVYLRNASRASSR
jgi:hypothetical protein